MGFGKNKENFEKFWREKRKRQNNERFSLSDRIFNSIPTFGGDRLFFCLKAKYQVASTQGALLL